MSVLMLALPYLGAGLVVALLGVQLLRRSTVDDTKGLQR
jgi:hypothetical protein